MAKIVKKQKAKLKLFVKNITKEHSIEDNETYLNVEVEISKIEGEKEALLETRKLGFPLHTTQEELVAELKKFKATFGSDMELAEKNAALDALHAQADETINSVKDMEI